MKKQVEVIVLLAVIAANSPVSRAIDGAASFAQNCQMCHQSAGVGLAGTFPRLAGRVATISSKLAGRAYLIDVLTYGMTGTITVDKAPLFGMMPSFAQLPDEQIALTLSYVQGLGDRPQKPPLKFTAEEVAARRAKGSKSAAGVLAERQTLEKNKTIP